jgi:hypothetical protein
VWSVVMLTDVPPLLVKVAVVAPSGTVAGDQLPGVS